jgi:hypothetical protein
MKKTAPALLLVLLLAAGAAAVYYTQRAGHGAPMAAAAYLPQDTIALLAIPDLPQVVSDWKTTDLYKIWSEPDVQAFLAMPLSKIPPSKDRDDQIAQAARLRPKNLFIALTALDEKTNQPHLLAGFQFKGQSADVDRLIAPAKEALREKFPAGKADLLNYQGHSLETFAAGDGNTLASVYLGDWYLVANDVELLKATIDRIDRRTPDSALSLEKDGDFQAVGAKLPAGYATLIYTRVQPFLSRIFALAAASGQPVDDQTKKRADKGRAFGATTKIENGRLRDTTYYLAPGMDQTVPNLQMSSLALSSAATVFYYAGTFQIPEKFDVPPSASADSPLPDPMAMLRMFGAQLQAKGITAQAAEAAFGSEAAFQLDWPANHAQPTAIWSVPVKDPAAAARFADAVASFPLGMATWQVQQAPPLTLRVLTVPNIDALQPTLAVTSKSLIVGLTIPSVKEAAARELGSAANNFSQSPDYKAAAAEVEKPNLAFSYLDTRALFERVYGVVKPAALLGAAFLYPQLNSYADLGKLPPAEAISRHLSPTVMSAVFDSQGELIESTGTVTLFQAGAVLAGGLGAVAMPYLGNIYAGMPPHAKATITPAPSPAGSP